MNSTELMPLHASSTSRRCPGISITSPLRKCGIPSKPSTRLLPIVAHSWSCSANLSSNFSGGGITVTTITHAGKIALKSPQPPSHQAAASTATRNAAMPIHGDHITAAPARRTSETKSIGTVSHAEPPSSGRSASFRPRHAKTPAPASASGKNW